MGDHAVKDLKAQSYARKSMKIDFRVISKIVVGVVITAAPFVSRTTIGAIVYGAIILAVGLVEPVWCIYGVFLICANYGVASLGPEGSWTRVVIPTAVVVLMIRLMIKGRIPKPDRTWLCIAVFYIYAFLVSLVHDRIDFRLPAFAAVTLCLRLFVMQDYAILRATLRVYVYATLVSVLVGVLTMLQGALDVSATRFVGGYTDPNEFAKLLLLALAITMSTDVIPAGFRRNLIAIVLCVSVFLTYSKMGVFIGIGVLAVGAIGWMMNTAEKSGYPFALGSGILMCLALTSILLFVPLREWHVTASFMNRIVPLNSFELGIEEKLDFLTTARWSIYKTSVAVFVNSPLKAQLLGVGYNGSRELLATSIGRVISTHSVYLQTLLDFGLIGTSLFLCMLIVSADWTGHGILGFLRRNGVMCIYLLTFGAIAWLFNWSNILFFACVGTPSFRCLYGKDMG